MFSAEDNDKTCPYYMATPPTPTHRITRCWYLRRAIRSSSSGSWAPKAQSSQRLPGLAFAVCLEIDFISLFESVIFSQAFMRLCVCACLVAQSCLTLCNPMDCSPSGSSVHGISQARILDWGVRGSSHSGIEPRPPSLSVSHFFISVRFLIAFPVQCRYMSCSVRSGRSSLSLLVWWKSCLL